MDKKIIYRYMEYSHCGYENCLKYVGKVSMENEGIRINKYLSDAGVCSRREADRAVERGMVTINGRKAVLGDRIMPDDEIYFGKKCVSSADRDDKVILAYNKPAGVVCTEEKREKNNIRNAIDYPIRVYPVGRLDKDSTGLIFLTNDGSIVNKIMRARNFHEKEYLVKVDKDIDVEFVKRMSGGIPILDTVTRPCTVNMLDSRNFSIVLTQGLNRQIRRMCEYLGYRVVSLKRVRIMNVKLGDLKEGTYRNLSDEEKAELFSMIN